jgi:acetylornithine deacetylase/succinyl-diaminopimelate desuccinylase-like protein
MDTRKTYATRSMYCAAAMLAAGADFIGSEEGDSGRAQFIFANDEEKAWKLAQAYQQRAMNPTPQPAAVIDALFRLRDGVRTQFGR